MKGEVHLLSHTNVQMAMTTKHNLTDTQVLLNSWLLKLLRVREQGVRTWSARGSTEQMVKFKLSPVWQVSFPSNYVCIHPGVS